MYLFVSLPTLLFFCPYLVPLRFLFLSLKASAIENPRFFRWWLIEFGSLLLCGAGGVAAVEWGARSKVFEGGEGATANVVLSCIANGYCGLGIILALVLAIRQAKSSKSDKANMCLSYSFALLCLCYGLAVPFCVNWMVQSIRDYYLIG